MRPWFPTAWVAATHRTRPLKFPFTEAVQRDRQSGSTLPLDRGKLMTAMFSRAQVYEALALAMFAGVVVVFTQLIVPLIAD
jgi:hypothetical protein